MDARGHYDVYEQAGCVEMASTRVALEPGKAGIAEECARAGCKSRGSNEGMGVGVSGGFEEQARSLFTEEAHLQNVESHGRPPVGAQADSGASILYRYNDL
jgi:hypothetical protein